MDFSHLPDDVFLKILEYLSFEGCIRMGRVNKAFRRISQYATSQTTTLDLTEDRFRNLSADQLANILDLCSPNLKAIEFPSDSSMKIQMATILANYQCPKLVDLDLGDIPINNAIFDQLIRNNPNVERLIWQAEFVGFPNVTCNSLKILNLKINGDACLQTLIGRCPNLDALILVTKNITGNVLDEFFASTQQIQWVDIRSVDNQIVFEDLVFFWNLPLTSLSVRFDGDRSMIAKDGILQKVATSFPRLQRLAIEVSDTSDHDIAALTVLQELEDLEMVSEYIELHHDDGIRELVACKKLRSLNFSSSIITPATLIALAGGCPQLERVLICAVDEVFTPGEAAIVLGSLAGIPNREFVIKFHPDDEMEDELTFIWESEVVYEAITNLQQNGGLEVYIDWNETDELTDEEMDDE